jgi:hypothetical protein
VPTIIEARVTINLPHDSAGQTAGPGQIIRVDADDPGIIGYLTAGFLVPCTALDFDPALQPPAAATPDDETADALADAPAPETAAEAPTRGRSRRSA